MKKILFETQTLQVHNELSYDDMPMTIPITGEIVLTIKPGDVLSISHGYKKQGLGMVIDINITKNGCSLTPVIKRENEE